MISIPGSLSFAQSTPAKSPGDARYASKDPCTESTLARTISTLICIRCAFLLRRTQLNVIFNDVDNDVYLLSPLTATFPGCSRDSLLLNTGGEVWSKKIIEKAKNKRDP